MNINPFTSKIIGGIELEGQSGLRYTTRINVNLAILPVVIVSVDMKMRLQVVFWFPYGQFEFHEATPLDHTRSGENRHEWILRCVRMELEYRFGKGDPRVSKLLRVIDMAEDRLLLKVMRTSQKLRQSADDRERLEAYLDEEDQAARDSREAAERALKALVDHSIGNPSSDVESDSEHTIIS